MVRVTNGLQRHKRHKKFRALAKGFRLGRGNVYKQIRLALVKQGQHAYIGRKEKKRDMRTLRIERLSAVVRQKGSSYSAFINQLTKGKVLLNRKVLSNVALAFPTVFDMIYEKVASK